MNKSKGLGDTIEKVTKKTGIKTMTDIISKGLNVPCGCEGRRDALNKIFPYKQKEYEHFNYNSNIRSNSNSLFDYASFRKNQRCRWRFYRRFN